MNDAIIMNNAHEWQQKASKLDQNDDLSTCKDLFELPANIVYLDGNSLGPMPIAAKLQAKEVVEQQWAQGLITSWNTHQWIDLPQQVGERIAPLLGAKKNQVISCDSISVNLFKLLSAAILANAPRKIVLSQKDNFPTDLYMVDGLSSLMGTEKVELVSLASDQILDFIAREGEHVSVLMLTHVNFRSGEIHNMQEITALAHSKGILTIWDLAHSAGIVPLELDECNVDFAVGCGYKYLNGGPGAPAFVYVNQRHLNTISQPLSGWMGHAAPFAFEHDYEASPNIKKMLCGTPNVISMSILHAALSIFERASIAQIRKKSMCMLAYVETLIDDQPSLSDLHLITPSNPDIRGSQLAYEHPKAYEICQALIAFGVIADFRAPNILRFGFAPLYLSFDDCFNALVILTNIMHGKVYEQAKYGLKHAVT